MYHLKTITYTINIAVQVNLKLQIAFLLTYTYIPPNPLNVFVITVIICIPTKVEVVEEIIKIIFKAITSNKSVMEATYINHVCRP